MLTFGLIVKRSTIRLSLRRVRRRTSEQCKKLRADGQDLFVLAHGQTVLPTVCDRRAVALASRVVEDPPQRLGWWSFADESIDGVRVVHEVTYDVVVHERVDSVWILTHQTLTADDVTYYCPAVQRRFRHHFLRTSLHHTTHHTPFTNRTISASSAAATTKSRLGLKRHCIHDKHNGVLGRRGREPQNFWLLETCQKIFFRRTIFSPNNAKFGTENPYLEKIQKQKKSLARFYSSVDLSSWFRI